MKIALIGYGDWGKNIARTLNELGCLFAICDIDCKKRLEADEDHPGLLIVSDYKELLDKELLDGVIIATPSIQHYRIACDFISQCIPVLVEKPITLNYMDANLLREKAEAKEVIFMAGHLMEYHPAIEKLTEIVHSKEFGELKHIRTTRVNLGKIRPDENVWWSFAPHDLSIISSLINEDPESYQAQSFKPLQNRLDDTVYVDINYKSGKSAHIHLSWLEPIKTHQAMIVFENALIMFNDTQKENKLMLYRYAYDKKVPLLNKESEEPLDYCCIEPLRNECQHFISCIKNNSIPKTNAIRACKIIKIMEDVQYLIDRKGNTLN